jgi:UDP-glucuronate 4-epimerase
MPHLVYASTSSVYGANQRLPYSEHDAADHPLQLYAATKRANELMAHSYSHLYRLPTTGLRFFTVYGPWARPDMAMSKFAAAILAGAPVDLLNYGEHRRDFTYIDDLVEAILAVRDDIPSGVTSGQRDNPDAATSTAPWRLLNIGGGNPTRVSDLLDLIEAALGRKAIRRLVERHPDDMEDTWADLAEITAATGFRARVSLEEGVGRFAQWYLKYASQG